MKNLENKNKIISNGYQVNLIVKENNKYNCVVYKELFVLVMLE